MAYLVVVLKIMFYLIFVLSILKILVLFYKERIIQSLSGVLFYVIGLLLTILCVCSFFSNILYVTLGEKTEGEIIDYAISYTKNEDNREDTLCAPIFSYLDENHIRNSFTSKINFTSIKEIPLGAKKKIYYMKGIKNSGFYNDLSHWFSSLLGMVTGSVILYFLYIFSPTQFENKKNEI